MINEILSQAFELKEQGYYKKALEFFYKALELDNTSNELLYEIAEMYFLLKKEEHALNYIEQILEFNPVHVQSLKLLKKVFINTKAFSEAEQTAKNIFLITNNDNDLAEVLRLLNLQCKYDEVLQQKINENNTKLVYEKAIALIAKRDFETARIYLEKYITQNDENLLFLLGEVYYKLSQYNSSHEILKNLSIQHTNSRFLNYAALVELQQGNYKKSIEYFKSAISIEPKNPEYYYNIGNAYFLDDNIFLAKKNYNIAVSIEPNNELFNLALAKLYYKEKNYKRGMEFLKGNSFDSLIMRAIILYDAGYYALALQEFDNLAQNNPNNQTILEYKRMIADKLVL